VNTLNPTDVETDAECERYSSLLKAYPTDIVCMGIGENGHIAFNDPHVADFNDKALVKKVDLDEVCRKQQVNDGCFEKIDDVPKFALTLTIPALTAASHMFCIVPCFTKAEAVKNTMEGEISILCPASILRKHESAKLYLDKDSAKMLSK
jgi:glucosamine-6-phosphate deaminase